MKESLIESLQASLVESLNVAYNAGYKDGLEEGEENCKETEEGSFKDGLDAAWKDIRTIVDMPVTVAEDLFNTSDIVAIINEHDASEVHSIIELDYDETAKPAFELNDIIENVETKDRYLIVGLIDNLTYDCLSGRDFNIAQVNVSADHYIKVSKSSVTAIPVADNGQLIYDDAIVNDDKNYYENNSITDGRYVDI